MKSKNYNEFVEKFKPKLTTDDCYTPPAVYDAVVDWVKSHLDPLNGMEIVRPFYPGHSYKDYSYPGNAVVIDNPPFSIMKQIVGFYADREMPFFLFAPHLMLFSYIERATCVICNDIVTYENGAKINTSFVTNMYKEDYAFCIEPTLSEAIRIADESLRKKKSVAKINHPINVASAALLGKIASQEWRVGRESVCHIKMAGKKNIDIFGSGVLLSERAAMERAAMERAAMERAAMERAAMERAAMERAAMERAVCYELTEREKKIIKTLK